MRSFHILPLYLFTARWGATRFFLIVIFLYATSGVMHGQGWRKVYLPEVDSTVGFIQFTDSLNGWVYGERQAFVTTNGGNVWRKVTYPGGNGGTTRSMK